MTDPQSKDLRAFPVHSMYAGKNGCPSFVRWEALSEEWASKNHDQTLTRLAERGGLDPTEIVANLERRAYHDRPLSVATAIKLIEPYACENPRVEAKSSKERSIPGAGAEQLAELFHATYERLAPEFGYTTRTDTRRFDRGSHNGKLMIAVCDEILRWFDRQDDEIRHLRTALQIIADGTLCPDLFPALDVEKDVWEMQAKTAMTSAIAALERDVDAPESRDG